MSFAPYFNPANADDLRLLPVAMRSSNDVPELAALCEADVLNVFTRDLTAYLVTGIPWGTRMLVYRPAVQLLEDDGVTLSNRWVFLRGYTQDAAQAPSGLKLALKRSIAEVVRWRFATWKADLLVQSESDQQGQTKTMRPETLEPFPPGWDRWITVYDTREPLWGI